jgi:hypothetical protein
MIDPSDLIHRANELRQQAEHESDQAIRDRLIRMADSYVHLAESENWAKAHPASAASLGDVFVKGGRN